MKRLVAVGLSIGILAGLFTWVAFGEVTKLGSWKAPLIVWVGFAAWACFYAVGGGTAGAPKAWASTLSGAFWGWLIVLAWLHVDATAMGVLGVFVGVGAFAMCVQATVPLLAFIPGAFIGAAAYFGAGSAAGFKGPIFWSVFLSLFLGTTFAFLSERGADLIEKAMGLAIGDPEQLGGSHQTPGGAVAG